MRKCKRGRKGQRFAHRGLRISSRIEAPPVKPGDTLSKIAKEEYGDANTYMKIFEANKPMLSNPDKIYPGQMLRIPAD